MALTYDKVVAAGKGWTSVRTSDGRTVTVQGTRSTRNNNPGNLEYGSFARAHGAIGTDGRFAVFPDRQTGLQAMGVRVSSGRYADRTLSAAISMYAPPNENNTRAYAARVAKESGVPLDTKMRDVPASKLGAITQAMTGVEGLGRASIYEGGRKIGVIDPRKTATLDRVTRGGPLAPISPEDRRLADSWGYQDPTKTRGLSTPKNTPVPGGLLDDPRHMAALSTGLLGYAATPTARPDARFAGLLGAPTAPMGPHLGLSTGRPATPTSAPRSQPTQVASLSPAVMDRMAGFGNMPSPAENARVDAATAAAKTRTADLFPAVMDRMGGFPSTPAPQQAALSPSIMDRMGPAPTAPTPSVRSDALAALSPAANAAAAKTSVGGLLGVSPAQASTMPGQPTNGLLSPASPAMSPQTNFAGPMGSPRAAGLLDQAPSVPADPLAAAYAQTSTVPQMPTPTPVAPAPQVTPMAYDRPAPAPVSVPALQAPPPNIQGPVGIGRQQNQPNISPDYGHAVDATTRSQRDAATAAAAANMTSPMSGFSGVTMGGILGGAMAGIPGMAIGGLLGSQTVRDALGIGDWGKQANWNAGTGTGTGLLTGKAIPTEITDRYGFNPMGGGFTGLGLPDIPNAPQQTGMAANPGGLLGGMFGGNGGYGSVSDSAKSASQSNPGGGFW